MTIKENYLRAIRNQSPDWVPKNGEAVKTIMPPICERPNSAGKDVFGCEWALNVKAEGGTYPAERNFVLTDITNWRKQVILPDVEAYDWKKAREEAEAIDRKKYLVGGFIEMGIFERIYLLILRRERPRRCAPHRGSLRSPPPDGTRRFQFCLEWCCRCCPAAASHRSGSHHIEW